MNKLITATLGTLAVLMLALLSVGLFGAEHASDQQITLLGLSILTGFVANALGYWALSR